MPTPPAPSTSRGPAPLVARLRDLVAFDTQNPAGDERPLADKLAADLRALGAVDVKVLSEGRHASVYGRLGGSPARLLINAHIDTVPANTGYTRPPLALEQADGRVYGLGAADTKGAIAAVLDALALCRDRGRTPDGIALLFSGDEERGGTCVRAFLQQPLARGLERAIACEPTGCRIGIRHRGIASAHAIARSPGGHSSRADVLPAPMVILSRVALACDELGRAHRDQGPPGFPGLCMNVASIDGGIAMNVIPARAELACSMRPPPGADVNALLGELHRRAIAAAAPDAIEWRVDHANPTFATRDVARWVTRLGPGAGAPVDLDFWTEAALFAEVGIDAVVFGPGHIEQAHAPDEYVEIDQLVRARDVFVQVLAP